jgi:glycosyltransferase involved in cell wall biosynthesis
MRLGLIIYGSLETVSGGYLYDRKLVEYLRAQGDQVEIVSLPWRNYTRHMGDNFSMALYRRLKALEVDVLLQDELNHPSLAWMNTRLKRDIRCPIATIVHHLRSSEERPAWLNRFYKLVERRYLETTDALVLNSRATREAVAGIGIDPGTRPHLVAYPAGNRLEEDIPEAEISRRAFQSGPLRLLFLGNLIPRKGLHTLLAALEILPESAFTLTVVGSSAADQAYVRAIGHQLARTSLGNRVIMAGALEDGKLIELLRASHVLVVPSSYEGFGIVYLEGMGFGLPAIAATRGGAQEIITHGVDGYLIPPGDAARLAEYLGGLATDRERLLQFSQAARQRYLAHPTWEDTTRSIRGFLRDLAATRRNIA